MAVHLLIVAAVLISGFSLAATLSAWADQRRVRMPLAALIVGASMFGVAHLLAADGLSLQVISLAFVEVAAGIVN